MSPTTRVSVGGGTPAIEMVRGRGISVWDSTGKEYLDCTSQSWALYLGHAHEEMRAHATKVMTDVWHVHQGFSTTQREKFAEDLLHLVPNNKDYSKYDRVAFTATSGLAVETAIKLSVLQGSGRNVVGRVEGGFHGTTLGTAQASWPASPEVSSERRTLAAFREFGGNFVTLRFPGWTSDEIDSASVSTLKDQLDEELDECANTLLAVIVEPIQGSGGQREVPRWWLEHLCHRAEKDGFFVIFDEIQTYIRAGRFYSWIDELSPHFVALGKGLCGGLASGAVLIRSDVQGFPPGGVYDLHTFGSSALAHSLGSKLIEIVQRDSLLDAANVRGEQFRSRLLSLRSLYPKIRDVRQVGLHIGVDMGPKGGAVAADIRQRALRKGLLLGLGGFMPQVVKIKPPLIITPEEVDQVVGILAEVLDQVGHE